jgi:aconitate hydratase
MYLGVRVVIAKAIERIHLANLINFAILPLTFADGAAYDGIDAGDELRIEHADRAIASAETVEVQNVTKGTRFTCRISLTARQRKALLAGGLLNYTRQSAK